MSFSRMPLRDLLMAAILMGVMVAANIVAVAFGLPAQVRPALFITPISFALVWFGYEVSLRIYARRSGGDERTMAKTAAFLGSILSLFAGVMVVAHLTLLGRFIWFHDLTTAQFMRTYMAAIGVIVMIVFDRAPKAMTIAPDGPLAKLRVHRAAAGVGVICGLGMVIAAVAAPRPQMFLWLCALAVAPVALNRFLLWKERAPPSA
jgi:hypothetical protein